MNVSKLMLCGAAGVAMTASGALATIQVFTTTLNGSQESPPVVTAGTGTGVFTYDDVAHTLRMQVSFSGLTGTSTLAHIHASSTLTPFSGNAGVAVQPPSLTGFPLGVTSGTYDATFDLTQATTYNSSYVTASGGTLALAEAALISQMSSGRAYFNIHTSFVGSGEIRGFIPAPGASALLGVAGLVAMRRRR